MGFTHHPKTASEIAIWAREMCGSMYYIKKEIYAIINIIDLLKLSAIAFKSYLPEIKSTQLAMIHSFKIELAKLKTKSIILEKVYSSLNSSNSEKELHIMGDMNLFKNEVGLYETSIEELLNRISNIKNLQFLVQKADLKIKCKKEIDEYVSQAMREFNYLYQLKKEYRQTSHTDHFEHSVFTEFKLKNIKQLKNKAIDLYQNKVIVHFFEFHSLFEKWMVDLITLHNEVIVVQKKLGEFEFKLNFCITENERKLDGHIDRIINKIGNINNNSTKINQNITLSSDNKTINNPLYQLTPCHDNDQVKLNNINNSEKAIMTSLSHR
jgi:hypothetical protein